MTLGEPLVRRAHRGALRHTDGVPSWGSYSFAFGPLVAFATLGVLVVILRWAFARGGSLVQRRPQAGSQEEYGLLVPVASPATFVEAELVRQRLVEHNIRATLAPTTDGPRVMVFPDELRAAEAVLRSPSG